MQARQLAESTGVDGDLGLAVAVGCAVGLGVDVGVRVGRGVVVSVGVGSGFSLAGGGGVGFAVGVGVGVGRGVRVGVAETSRAVGLGAAEAGLWTRGRSGPAVESVAEQALVRAIAMAITVANAGRARTDPSRG